MNNNFYLLPLSSEELVSVNGGSAAYDAGYSVGYHIGIGVKTWLTLMGLYK